MQPMPGLRRLVFATAAAAVIALAPAPLAGETRFPFDLELLMETPPIPPGKRMPAIKVSQNGSAVIDLWCRSVRAAFEVGAGTVSIQAEPLPESLPTMLSRGQCTDARIAADERVLVALTQMTGWRRQGEAVIFTGATTTLRFRPSDH